MDNRKHAVTNTHLADHSLRNTVIWPTGLRNLHLPVHNGWYTAITAK